jgi:hypothetical protein
MPWSMAKQLEYKLEQRSSDTDTFAQYLSDESVEGWELVTVMQAEGGDGGRPLQRLVFRRELANPTWEQPQG